MTHTIDHTHTHETKTQKPYVHSIAAMLDEEEGRTEFYDDCTRRSAISR